MTREESNKQLRAASIELECAALVYARTDLRNVAEALGKLIEAAAAYDRAVEEWWAVGKDRGRE